MKITFLLPILTRAALAAPVLSQGNMQKTPMPESLNAVQNSFSRPVPQFKTLGLYIDAMVHIVTQLAEAFKNQNSDSSKVAYDAAFAKVEKPLSALVLLSGDAADALNKGTTQLDDYASLAKSLKTLSDVVLPLTEAIPSLKKLPGIAKYQKVIVTALQTQVHGFDILYQALKQALAKSEDNSLKIAVAEFGGYLLEIICHIDDAIAAFDPQAKLTDQNLCGDRTQGKKHCTYRDWKELPKQLPGFKECDNDPRYFLYTCYKTQCFETSCQGKDWGRYKPKDWDACTWKPTNDQWVCKGNQGSGKKSSPKPTDAHQPTPKHKTHHHKTLHHHHKHDHKTTKSHHKHDTADCES